MSSIFGPAGNAEIDSKLRRICLPMPCRLIARWWNSFFHPVASVDRQLRYLTGIGSKKIVPKPDHIADLERRQKVLEDEIRKALLHCSTDDPMIIDLKRRALLIEN